jgi:hypothetical protein
MYEFIEQRYKWELGQVDRLIFEGRSFIEK